jgi:hypothetical protein
MYLTTCSISVSAHVQMFMLCTKRSNGGIFDACIVPCNYPRINTCYQLPISVVNRSANQHERPGHLVAVV